MRLLIHYDYLFLPIETETARHSLEKKNKKGKEGKTITAPLYSGCDVQNGCQQSLPDYIWNCQYLTTRANLISSSKCSKETNDSVHCDLVSFLQDVLKIAHICSVGKVTIQQPSGQPSQKYLISSFMLIRMVVGQDSPPCIYFCLRNCLFIYVCGLKTICRGSTATVVRTQGVLYQAMCKTTII